MRSPAISFLGKKIRATTAVYLHLPTAVYWLFLVRVLVTTGNFVYPMLTLYLTQRLGMKDDAAGFVLMLLTVASLGGTTLGGLLADLWPRRLVISGSLLLAGLAYLLVLLCQQPMYIIALIVLSMGIYSASLPATNALIADITPEERRTDAFSLNYLGLSTAYCIAPVLASLLFAKWPSVLFAIDGAATLLGGLVIYGLLGSSPSPEGRPSEQPQSPIATHGRLNWDFFKELTRNRLILVFSLVYMIHTFIYSQTTFSLPLFLHELSPEKGISEYGLVMALNSASVFLLSPVLTKLTEGIAPLAKCALAGVLFAVGFGSYFFVKSFLGIALGAFVWSAAEIFSFTNARAYVANNSKEHNRGRMNMILELMHEVGYGLGPLCMGLVMVRGSIHLVWLFMFASGMLSALLLWVLHKRSPPISLSGVARFDDAADQANVALSQARAEDER